MSVTAEELAAGLAALIRTAFDMDSQEVGEAFLDWVAEMEADPDEVGTYGDKGLMTSEDGVIVPEVEGDVEFHFTVTAQVKRGW